MSVRRSRLDRSKSIRKRETLVYKARRAHRIKKMFPPDRSADAPFSFVIPSLSPAADASTLPPHPRRAIPSARGGGSPGSFFSRLSRSSASRCAAALGEPRRKPGRVP